MLSYFFSLKTGSHKKIPHPQIKIQSLSVSSFFLSYKDLLNQDRARYTIVFLICLFRIYMQKPGRVVFRKLQSNAFVRLQTIKKKSLVQEGDMFGVLRKHRSEAYERRLCLVLALLFFFSLLSINKILFSTLRTKRRSLLTVRTIAIDFVYYNLTKKTWSAKIPPM